jgi:hypothetical protein
MNFYTISESKSWADIQEEEEKRIENEQKNKPQKPPSSDKKIFNKSNDNK